MITRRGPEATMVVLMPFESAIILFGHSILEPSYGVLRSDDCGSPCLRGDSVSRVLGDYGAIGPFLIHPANFQGAVEGGRSRAGLYAAGPEGQYSKA